MKYKDPITGKYKELFLKASDTLPIGAIVPYGSDDIPTNWLLCDGSAVSRTTYANLFSVIGTNFGEGNGETTFNLPDFRSKIPLGKDISDEDFNTLGKTYGEKEHTLTIDEIPSHTHRITNFRGSGSQSWGGVTGTANVDGVVLGTVSTTETGGGLPHNIVQPSLVTNYIIKAGMSVGVIGNVVNEKTNSSKDTYSCEYINKINTYSTEEQIVGKWTNSKPLYRKTIQASALTTAFSTGVNNIDILIFDLGNSYLYWNEKMIYGAERAKFFYNRENNTIASQEAELSNWSAVLTIKYTKTTDIVEE